MVNVHIVYNPLLEELLISYNKKKLKNRLNKIVSFSNELDFKTIISPYTHKYKVWQGLLAELIRDLNDDELDIVFEGRKIEFEALENAFNNSKDIVTRFGYKNNWKLSHMPSFEINNILENLIEIIGEMKEKFTDKTDINKLNQLEQILSNSTHPNDLNTVKESLFKLIVNRLVQIEQSDSRYKSADIGMIKMLKNRIVEILDYAELGVE